MKYCLKAKNIEAISNCFVAFILEHPVLSKYFFLPRDREGWGVNIGFEDFIRVNRINFNKYGLKFDICYYCLTKIFCFECSNDNNQVLGQVLHPDDVFDVIQSNSLVTLAYTPG